MDAHAFQEDRPIEAIQGYAEPSERPPLLAYTILVAIFNALFAAALVAAKRTGRQLPERVGVTDLVLIGIASHKLSRLVSKDKVTSPLRAPFTELEGSAGPGELEERSRGKGARKAIGELLVCPYCLGLWVVASFSIGLLFAPRLTRFLAAIFSALTISDFLQIAYKAGREEGPRLRPHRCRDRWRTPSSGSPLKSRSASGDSTLGQQRRRDRLRDLRRDPLRGLPAGRRDQPDGPGPRRPFGAAALPRPGPWRTDQHVVRLGSRLLPPGDPVRGQQERRPRAFRVPAQRAGRRARHRRGDDRAAGRRHADLRARRQLHRPPGPADPADPAAGGDRPRDRGLRQSAEARGQLRAARARSRGPAGPQ